MILLITHRSQAILLEVPRVARNPFIGVDLFDMMGRVLGDYWGGGIVAGAVVVRRHAGQEEVIWRGD